MDLENTTLKTKAEQEQLQTEEQQELANAQAMANPEAQKALTEEPVQPDLKPLDHQNLSSTGAETKGTL